jgi:hypothetical protein
MSFVEIPRAAFRMSKVRERLWRRDAYFGAAVGLHPIALACSCSQPLYLRAVHSLRCGKIACSLCLRMLIQVSQLQGPSMGASGCLPV